MLGVPYPVPVIGNVGFVISTVTDAEATAFPFIVNSIITMGYEAPDDKGGGYYSRVNVEPAHPGKFQDASGAWFELSANEDGFVTTAQLGCFGGTTDVVDIFNGALDHYGRLMMLLNDNPFTVSDTILVPSNGELRGEHPAVTIIGTDNRQPHQYLVANKTLRPETNADRDVNVVWRNFSLDGNKANNASQGEWGHGLSIMAVNGAVVSNVYAKNCRGDGICLHYGYNTLDGATDTWCERVIITNPDCSGNTRQGMALVGASKITITGGNFYSNTLFGFDIEPEAPGPYGEDIYAQFNSYSNGNGSASSGGYAVYGHSTNSAKRVIIDAEVYNCNGSGIVLRDVVGIKCRGSVNNITTGYGVWIADGETFATIADFDITVGAAPYLMRTQGQCSITGKIVGTEATTVSKFAFEKMNNSDVTLISETAINSQGLTLINCQGNTFRGSITNNTSYACWVRSTSSNNTFVDMDFSASGSGPSKGVLEDAGCNNNTWINCSTNQTAGWITLNGTNSSFLGSTWSNSAALVFSIPAALSAYSTSTTNISVTGAEPGDRINIVNPQVSDPNYGPLEATVVSTGNIAIRSRQYAGTLAAIPNRTVKVLVQKQL